MNKPSALSFFYDETTDVFKIEGVRYSGDLFRGFGKMGKTPEGNCLRILGNEDGCLVLEQRSHDVWR